MYIVLFLKWPATSLHYFVSSSIRVCENLVVERAIETKLYIFPFISRCSTTSFTVFSRYRNKLYIFSSFLVVVHRFIVVVHRFLLHCLDNFGNHRKMYINAWNGFENCTNYSSSEIHIPLDVRVAEGIPREHLRFIPAGRIP